MGLAEWFGWETGASGSRELPEIFPLPITQIDFISTDVITIYSKILTDTLERVHGLSEDQIPLLWDNCVKSSKSDGLITLLAKAMNDKSDLYIVYDKGVNVVRVATTAEQATIAADYLKKAESAAGVFITFRSYRKSDMVRLYSALEYSTVAALNKSMNLSAAVQLKIHKLREAVSLVDAEKAEIQAEAIAKALLNQRPVLLDSEDVVETASPTLDATEKSIEFISTKLAFYLGLPASYITGVQTGGIGSTGEADTKAVERGLKAYFFSILKPVLEATFGATLEYKSQDTTFMDSALNVLKIFSLTDDQLMSKDNKTKIVNRTFGLNDEEVGDAAPKPDPKLITAPPAAPAKGAPNGAT